MFYNCRCRFVLSVTKTVYVNDIVNFVQQTTPVLFDCATTTHCQLTRLT